MLPLKNMKLAGDIIRLNQYLAVFKGRKYPLLGNILT